MIDNKNCCINAASHTHTLGNKSYAQSIDSEHSDHIAIVWCYYKCYSRIVCYNAGIPSHTFFLPLCLSVYLSLYVFLALSLSFSLSLSPLLSLTLSPSVSFNKGTEVKIMIEWKARNSCGNWTRQHGGNATVPVGKWKQIGRHAGGRRLFWSLWAADMHS